VSQTTAGKTYFSFTDVSNWTHFCDTLLGSKFVKHHQQTWYCMAGLHRFYKDLGAISKFLAPGGWDETCYILKTHKYWTPSYKKKISRHGDQWPGICATPLDGSNYCPTPLHKSVFPIWEIPQILSRHHTPYMLYTVIWSSTRRGRRTKPKLR
jgi:hypothetical protein